MHLCQQAGIELGQADPELPYWAFPWVGGLAVAHHLVQHPEEVAGRRVLDMASGSGLCAIAALRAGAASVEAADVDPLSEAAVWLNARANQVRVGFTRQDLLESEPPDHDVILAGDVCYQELLATRILPWLRLAAGRGTRVLIGDPGRSHLPAGLERVAVYRVETTRELQDAAVKQATVYTFPLSG
jgi:predicted nicotinamide N-methyase